MDDRADYLQVLSTVRRHLEERAELARPLEKDAAFAAKSADSVQDEAPPPSKSEAETQAPPSNSEAETQAPPSADALSALAAEASVCELCPLYATRTNVVFGSGNPNADLMFVGEAPGRDEDLKGLPFVGRAGQLLTKIIEAMGLRREDVYIANLLKCRPPENRNPLPLEAERCRPYLERQIALIQPKAVVALGSYAAAALLNSRERISKLRGNFHALGGVQVMPTYHPAYLLRNPGGKRYVWEDMQKVMGLLGLEQKGNEQG